MKSLRIILGYLLVSLTIAGLYFFSKNREISADILRSQKNSVRVSFLDIGQGDAIYIRTNTGEDALIDGGPAAQQGLPPVISELSSVMPLFDRELDLVIVTHNHADHIGGLDEVLQKYSAKEIWISGAVHTTQSYLTLLKQIKKQKEHGATVKKVALGEKRNLGRTTISVLFPIEVQAGQNPKDQHDATIVIKLTDGQISFMLTGDLNEDHEKQILQIFRDHLDFLRSPILKAPHHGSKTGLLMEFLNAISPEIVVISVGARNSFGHPAPSIINKLQSANIPVYRTDQNGRVTVFSDGEKYEVKTER